MPISSVSLVKKGKLRITLIIFGWLWRVHTTRHSQPKIIKVILNFPFLTRFLITDATFAKKMIEK